MTKESDNTLKGEVILYKIGKDIEIDVKLKNDTVWLTQNQMAQLFQQKKQTISLHINNIFKEKELSRSSTVRKYLTVQSEGKRTVKRNLDYYNLDVIISLGYRVKSKRGTQFRIWANKILKDYLIRGYVLNEKVLKEKNERIKDLETALDIFSQVVNQQQIGKDEFSGILKVVTDYTYALDTLDEYDFQKLKISGTTKKEIFQITYDNSKMVIEKMKERFGGSKLFGKEKDDSFKGSIGAIYQTFCKKDVYPSIEEKAAHLLYFTIKNH